MSSGHRSGTILVNGIPREEASFRELSAYVMQEDALVGTSTVIETLNFAMNMSGGQLSREERKAKSESGFLVRSFLDLTVSSVFIFISDNS